MPYTPDATDPTQPVDLQKASSMGLEFRTLKGYIQTVIVPAIAAKIGGTGGTTTGPITTVFNGFGFNSIPPDEAGYAGFRIENAALSRVMELVYIGTSAGAIYGGAHGDTVLNVNSGNFKISTGDALAITVNHAGAVDLEHEITSKQFIRSWIGGANGSIILQTGDGAHTGYLAFFIPGGVTRKSYIGYSTTGGPTEFVADDGSQWQFSSGVVAPSFIGPVVGNASSASSVPWTGVSGRPTNLSQFVNDLPAGGGSGVSSYNGRTGAVTALSSDVTGALGFTPYNSSNPSAFINLAAVAAAGYVTNTGSVAFATLAGNGISTINHTDDFIGVDAGVGYDLTNVTLSISGSTLTCTRRKVYRTAADIGGGGP